MEQENVVNHKKGLTTSIISSILTTASIVFCILFAVMVNEHFELQATAEDFEGLGSIGIILVAIIFALVSLSCDLISSVFSITTILRSSKQFKVVGIILCSVNFLVLLGNIVIFIILRSA